MDKKQYIPQIPLKLLRKWVKPGKVVVIYGPRRTGKTTLLNHYLAEKERYILVNGENLQAQQYLGSRSVEMMRSYIGNTPLLVVDEAQHIDQIGLNLKMLIDNCPDLEIIATGSSSFELANQVGEPLVGRKWQIHLYPLAQLELAQIESRPESLDRLEHRLIYGSYPDVVLADSNEDRKHYLEELIDSYLYKDILQLDGIRHAKKILNLLQLLAHQIGKEVSVSELSKSLAVSYHTVDRYLDLLEKCFVITYLGGFSRNLRKEVVRNGRYYFYDVGVRNALINNFNLLSRRNDVGQLWENYLVMERIKLQKYTRLWSNNYFWRTYDQKEIDWIEDRDGQLHAYDFKYNDTGKRGIPKLWHNTYPDSTSQIVDRHNYLDFIT